MYLLLDIETIPRQDKPLPEFNPDTVKLGNLKDPDKIKEKLDSAKADFEQNIIKKASVTPELCQIVSCAWIINDENGRTINKGIFYDKDNDATLIAQIIQEIFNQTTIVTWNGKGFDLPVIWKRKIASGGSMPIMYYQRLIKKYDIDAHIDLMHVWNNYDYGKMEDCANFLGVESKTDFDGSMVYDAWKNGEHEKIKEYNMQDVLVMHEISKRIGIY